MTNTDKVLVAIKDHWRENALPPVIRAVQKVAGISSTSMVRVYYSKLEAQGEIKMINGKPVPISIFNLLTGDLPK